MSQKENIGYYRLWGYGNYFVKQYGDEVKISYYNGDEYIYLDLRETFNAVDVQENTY